ncbi:gliding motility-associated C-terminal domain-containing protein, partial [Lutibacter flavus]
STTPLNDTDSLINGEDYWAEQTDANGCSSANRLVVTATIISSQSKTEVTQSFCANDPSNSPLISDLTAPEEGLIWYNNETSTTPLNPDEILINGEDYWATLTDLSGCVGGSKFVVTVTFTSPLPPTTTEAIQTFCQIDNPTVANLNATGDNIIWYATETSTTPIGTDEDLINGEDYWATQTNDSGCESSERLVVTASIISTPPPTTTEVNQTYCEIDNPTVENLDVTGNAIVWYESETSTIPLNIDEALVNGEDYWATQTNDSGCESSERLVINTTIISSQSNTEVTQSFCTNDFTSNSPLVSDLIAPEDGLLWYDSDTSATPLDPNENLINGEDYWTTLSENSGCNGASKFVVTASIIIPLPPTTTETNQTFCEVNNPTVANLNVTGNDIIWYDSEISTTPLNPSDVLINNEDYWAEQTEDSGCKSASRLMVTATIVISTPPTTTESSQTFCEVDSPTVTNLNATGDNIVWYATETSTTPLGTDENLINGEDYWATQTVDSGCESSARLVVTAFINSTSPPTIIEANQSFCEIDNPTIANLNAIGNAITWYESETSTTPLNVNVILINGANYWATQTNATGCESATRIVVNTAIISSPPPTTTIANQTFCEIDNPTIADLTITGNEIIWYDSETSTAPLNVDAILINGEDYWATQTEASGCESVSRLEINAIISNLAIATTTQINQTFCSMDNPTIASLQVSGDSILWFDTETSTTPLNETDALIDGEDYWALNYDQTTGCESNSKLMITATILEVQSPTIENTFQVFCASSFPKISDLQANENIVWYATETETNPLKSTDLLINGANYWAAQSDSNSCESATRVVVNVTLTDAGTPLLNSIGNEFCSNFNPTLADLNENVSPLNGGIITWYDSYPNGNELSLTEFLNDSETYYAIESDSDGCSSANPLAVTVDLNACEQYDISIYDGFSPNGNGINDTFKIGNLRELYPDFKVEFYNRWGNLVYTSNISKPDWNGRLNGNDKLVTAGVYYFIIYFNKDDKKPIQRRLYLSR